MKLRLVPLNSYCWRKYVPSQSLRIGEWGWRPAILIEVLKCKIISSQMLRPLPSDDFEHLGTEIPSNMRNLANFYLGCHKRKIYTRSRTEA